MISKQVAKAADWGLSTSALKPGMWHGISGEASVASQCSLIASLDHRLVDAHSVPFSPLFSHVLSDLRKGSLAHVPDLTV